jgi:small subunit ribosomal protein S21e
MRVVLVSCSSTTNRIITAKDHASVQINIGHVDENGLYDGRFTTFALSGFIRAQVIIIVNFCLFTCA